MASNRARLATVGASYLALVLALVAASWLGLFPGMGDAFRGDRILGHPYRLTWGVAGLALGLYLGGWSALVGLASRPARAWIAGLLMLCAGGFITILALAFAPWIYYPNDKYSPAFLWLLSGAPMAFLTWVVVTIVGHRAT